MVPKQAMVPKKPGKSYGLLQSQKRACNKLNLSDKIKILNCGKETCF
jgi:hypothetical protein